MVLDISSWVICVFLCVVCLTKGLYFRRTPFPPTLFDFFIYDILNMDTAMLINNGVGGLGERPLVCCLSTWVSALGLAMN